ncbi:MAG: hypothetical protein EOP49_00540 [Sphingobacteriales bacterium]|nr:MAG: hypothetical protein EOP49_00540 [Sphingobacteriales bacterium]
MRKKLSAVEDSFENLRSLRRLRLRARLLVLLFFVSGRFVMGQQLRPGININDGSAIYSKNFADVMAGAMDPAAMIGQEGLSAGVAGERRFMLQELSAYTMAVSYGTQHTGVGLQLQTGGSAVFRESMAALSYARLLGKIRLGVQFNYHFINAGGYGSAGTASADVSLSWELTDKLRAGIHVYNPVPIAFGINKSEQYPTAFKLGAGYDVSAECHLYMAVSKLTTSRADVDFGLHYSIRQKLFLRLVMHTDVRGPMAAAGWQLKMLRLYITGSYHPELGFSPGLQLIVKQKKSA